MTEGNSVVDPDARVRTIVDVRSEFRDLVIPAGSEGYIVEVYSDPEGYAVDLAIPRPDLVGGKAWENVVLTPDQFVVIPRPAEEDEPGGGT
jgi:hypothetical protein